MSRVDVARAASICASAAGLVRSPVGHDASYAAAVGDAFADMMTASAPTMEEDQMITLFQLATGGDDPDKVEMTLIEMELRKANVTLKRKPGKEVAAGDGAGSADDVRLAGMALSLFGAKPPAAAEGQEKQYKFASKWRKAGLLSRSADILRDLEVMSSAEDKLPMTPV